ncbi:MAG: GGDEF domain-containing protein [Planctomycetes bacterium]|nr:GGDEF domain-containing protein [Planctomycetota bacterium]
MLGAIQSGAAIWALVAAAVLGPVVAVLLAVRDRQRLILRLGNLEDVLRRMRGSDTPFDDRGDESTLQLSRERIVLTTLLDRFPEVTQKFVNVEHIDELGERILGACERILGCDAGVAFIREGDRLRLVAQMGLPDHECKPGLVTPVGSGRIGYAALKCLILRPGDFATLDHDVHAEVERTRVFDRDFDFYIPLVHGGDAIGCLAIGGMKKVVQKAHTVCMALANLGALVITNLQRAAEIRALSETDPLTRLSNRRHAYAQLEARLAVRKTAPFALFLFDIDYFKRVNDEYGHHVGDRILVEVADAARAFVRREEGEFACRFGGEEFLCVLNCEDLPSLSARLESFRLAVGSIHAEAANQPDSMPIHISGGVAFCPAEREDADSLIRLADDRLYAAKERGRNQILFEARRREMAP